MTSLAVANEIDGFSTRLPEIDRSIYPRPSDLLVLSLEYVEYQKLSSLVHPRRRGAGNKRPVAF